MLQPFEKLKDVYVDRLIEMKKICLVSQSYARAFDHFAEGHKTDILVTDYEDLASAKVHLNAVSHDQYASIIDLSNQKHLGTIKRMLEPSSNYVVYWSVVKDAKKLEERLDLKYKDSMRRYISKHTSWRIGSGERIRPAFQVTFGELFIILKYGGQTLRVKFEEIEKA